MSEKIDDQGPKPRTRREVLEGHPSERGYWGPEVHATAEEPLPEVAHSGYRDVRLRPSRIEFEHRGFVIGTVTMVLVSLVFFYLPLFNSLVAGAFGGFFARRWGRALGAAVVASVLVPAFLAFLYGWDTPDTLYLFYGLGFWGWTALHVIGLFIGALAGVASRPLAERRRPREVRS